MFKSTVVNELKLGDCFVLTPGKPLWQIRRINREDVLAYGISLGNNGKLLKVNKTATVYVSN